MHTNHSAVLWGWYKPDWCHHKISIFTFINSQERMLTPKTNCWWNCWSLRCCWSIACRRCFNYIYILTNTWFEYIAQKQLQTETKNIYVLGFGAPYIRGFTIYITYHVTKLDTSVKSRFEIRNFKLILPSILPLSMFLHFVIRYKHYRYNIMRHIITTTRKFKWHTSPRLLYTIN